ncbi:hypothetical protein [uncultured Marinobacter sp.]|nr:hypothetical protein [uncultured Marinobacter sp.]
MQTTEQINYLELVPDLSLTSHTTMQVSHLPGILAGGELWSS